MSLEQQIEDYVNNAMQTKYYNTLVQGGNYEKNYCIGFSDASTLNADGGYNTRIDLSGDTFKVFTSKQPFIIKGSASVENGTLSTKNLVVGSVVVGSNTISYADEANESRDFNVSYNLHMDGTAMDKLSQAIGDFIYKVANSFNGMLSQNGSFSDIVPITYSDNYAEYSARSIFDTWFKDQDCIFSGELSGITEYSTGEATNSYVSFVVQQLFSMGNSNVELVYDANGKESDCRCEAAFSEPDEKGYRQLEGFELRLPLRLKFPSAILSALTKGQKINDYSVACNDLEYYLNKHYILNISHYSYSNVSFGLSEEYYGPIATWESGWDYGKNEPYWPLNIPYSIGLIFSMYLCIGYHNEKIDISNINSASDVAYLGDVKSLENTYKSLQRAIQKSNDILSCFEASSDQIEPLINKTLYQ